MKKFKGVYLQVKYPSLCLPKNPTMSATATTETKFAPRDRIKDTEVIDLIKAGKIIGVVTLLKNKKTAEESFPFELVYNDGHNTPVLTKDGAIDCRGKLMWGVQAADKRNTGKFAKKDGRFDVCDMTCGTKTSGTFGEMMCLINDVVWPGAVKRFTESPSQVDNYDGFEIEAHQFCKKYAGSLEKPPPKTERDAYTAAADWTFPLKIRLEKFTKDNVPIPGYRLFMTKLVEYKLNAFGLPVETPINVNKNNIHLELTRGTDLKVLVRPGNGSLKAESVGGKTYKKFNAAFDYPHITRIKKGSGGGISDAGRSPEEIRAMLAEAGVDLTMAGTQPSEDVGQPSDDDDCGESSASAATGAPATAEDIAKQLAGLNV